MASRIHRLGSIFSRVDGLIRKGHMKENDKPIWFDVYKHFPPMYEPVFKRNVPDTKVREIFYGEDRLRAKIHKILPARMNVIDLNKDCKEILSQKLLETCNKLVKQGMSETKAIEKVIAKFQAETPKESPSKPNIKQMLNEIF